MLSSDFRLVKPVLKLHRALTLDSRVGKDFPPLKGRYSSSEKLNGSHRFPKNLQKLGLGKIKIPSKNPIPKIPAWCNSSVTGKFLPSGSNLSLLEQIYLAACWPLRKNNLPNFGRFGNYVLRPCKNLREIFGGKFVVSFNSLDPQSFVSLNMIYCTTPGLLRRKSHLLIRKYRVWVRN